MYGLSPLLNKVFSKVLYLGRDSEGDIKTSQLRHQFESRKSTRLNALTWQVNPFELLFRHVQTNTKGSDTEVNLHRSLKLLIFSVVFIVSLGDVLVSLADTSKKWFHLWVGQDSALSSHPKAASVFEPMPAAPGFPNWSPV